MNRIRTQNGLSNSPIHKYSFYEKQIFKNKTPFSSQLRMIIVGNSGCGKSKLLFKILLENY